MSEEDKTLKEGYESLAKALAVKQEWQRRVLELVPLEPGEHLDAAVDRIRELIASRQAWAEEALHLDDQVRAKSRLSLVDKDDPSQVCYGSDRDMECTSRTFHLGSCPKSPSYMPPAVPANAPCACPTEEQLAKLGSGFTRPQCTVHPEHGGAE
jgi:hypothetical protein